MAPSSAIDNTILVERDYAHYRQEFLEQVTREGNRSRLATLGPYPYYFAQLFPKTSGWGAGGEIKKRVNLLRRLEPTFDRLLLDGEEIRYVTRGIYSSFLEQFFMGWMSYLINRTAFVFTNYRVILINVDSKGRPKHMRWHIPYERITKVTSSWLGGAMVIRLDDGSKLSFSGVPKYDRRRISLFTREMLRLWQELDFSLPSTRSRDNLCARCNRPVPGGNYECRNCGETFIHPNQPVVMSLILPCLGDFYLGHFGIGLMELAGYLFTWLLILGLLLSNEAEALLIALFILSFAHLGDALVTWVVARKGLIPRRCAWGRGRN